MIVATCRCGYSHEIPESRRYDRFHCKGCKAVITAAECERLEPLFEVETGPSGFELDLRDADGGYGLHTQSTLSALRRKRAKPRAFRNPSNGHVVRITWLGSFVGCLLLGCFYFLFKNSYKWALIAFLAAIATLCLSWLVFPFFAASCLRDDYWAKGWKPVDA